MEGLRNPEENLFSGSTIRLLKVRMDPTDPIELEEYCRLPKRLCLPPDTKIKAILKIIHLLGNYAYKGEH